MAAGARRRVEKRKAEDSNAGEESPELAAAWLSPAPTLLSTTVEPSDAPDGSAPMVFFCSTCRVIIADSMSAVCSDQDLGVLAFCRASSIKRQDVLSTSSSGPDRGSTFFALHCAHCGTAIGRYYITTPRVLDELRERFTFLVSALSSYALGGGDIGDPTVPGNAAGDTLPIREDARAEMVAVTVLAGDVMKLGSVVSYLTARVANLESATGTAPPQTLS